MLTTVSQKLSLHGVLDYLRAKSLSSNLNRLTILPRGVVSKNAIGAFRMLSRTLR